MSDLNFRDVFQAAMGNESLPYAYQCRLACGSQADPENADSLREGADCRSLLINVPTGLGKTAAVVFAWLWNRIFHSCKSHRGSWPRRLVYCLPMRTLVEQTRDSVQLWLHDLQASFGSDDRTDNDGLRWLSARSPVILMGGRETDLNTRAWDIWPEKPCILIGTQDMLLSRALNRGYAMSRYRWPVHFGLLNSDCLWVMDEVQLMGSGLTTSLQLQAWHDDIALRNRDFNQPNTKLPPLVLPTHSWWMSATAAEHWFKKSVAMRMRISELWENRLCADPRTDAKDLFEIPKILHRCAVRVPTPPTEGNEKWQQYAWRLANHLASGENRAGKNKASDAEETEDILILVVCNTVDRAVAVYEALAKLTKGSSNERLYDEFHLFLLHSRFRGNERRGWSEKFKALERGEGHYAGGPRIMVTTQVIEAGVDISAALLYTELCPLASLIQRLGRCARRAGESGKAFWIDFEALRTEPSGELSDLTEEEKYAARPYDPAEIVAARNALIRRDNGVPSIPQANPR